jgi:hypothetical protein
MKVVQLSDDDLQMLYQAFKGRRHRYCDFSDISELKTQSVYLLSAEDIVGYNYYDGLDDSD